MSGPWSDQAEALGSFIRAQRELAQLSLRQMAELAKVSNPYLSQIERGLHLPSVRVLKSIAQALNLSSETLLAHAGLHDQGQSAATRQSDVEAAIKADDRLSTDSKRALMTVYRSMLEPEAVTVPD